MDQLIARQLINSGWLVANLCLVVTLLYYLHAEVRIDGWYAYARNKAAIALLILFSGETIVRAWSFFLLRFYAKGVDAWPIEQRYPVALTGAVIALAGTACAVRVFSPKEWGHWGWIVSMALAAAFMLFTYVWR